MTQPNIKRRAILKAGALSSLGMAGIGLPFKQADAAITLRLSTSLTADPVYSVSAIWYKKFNELVQKNCNGQIAVQFFPDNQLGKEADIVSQLRLGIVDMMIGGSSIWSTVVPEVGVFDMGYLFNGWDTFGAALDGVPGKTVSKLLADRSGVRVLGWAFPPGVRSILAKAPVSSSAELKGKKIRVLPVTYFLETMKLMGAVATPLSFGEVYTALQAGVVDGFEHDAPTVLAGKYFEAAKVLTLTKHIYNPYNPMISARSFDSKIPKNLQEGFLAAAAEATTYSRGLAIKAEAQAMAKLKAQGVQIVEADRAGFRKDVMPLWQQFTDKYPNMRPVVDAIRTSNA